jgi:hypothetical protein
MTDEETDDIDICVICEARRTRPDRVVCDECQSDWEEAQP